MLNICHLLMNCVPVGTKVHTPPQSAARAVSFTPSRSSSFTRSQSPWKQTPDSGKGRKLFADGLVNGRSVSANIDSGASFNIISRKLAKTTGLIPSPKSRGSVSLPNRKRILTLGTATGKFNFQGENTTYPLTCVVMEDPVHDLVLGSQFLGITKTLTKYQSRIRNSSSDVLSLNLLGGQQDLLLGSCNGIGALVVPDTGSDLMVMSARYAKALRLKVHDDMSHREQVQFIDGSMALTDGLVKNVKWRFHSARNGKPTKYDFHIFNNLPPTVDAIVSNRFIDDHDVFNAHREWIYKDIQEDDGVYNIRLIKKRRKERCADIGSPDSHYLQDSKV